MSDETAVDALLDRWEELRRRGDPLSVEASVSRHCQGTSPAVVEAFKARARALQSQDVHLGAARGLATPGAEGDTGPSADEGGHLAVGSEPVPGHRLVRWLGRGRLGQVWAATGPGGVPVALKFVNLGDKTGKAELDALEQVKAIRHPPLLSVSGAWQTGGWLVIACDLAEGTLADLLRQCRDTGQAGI